MNPKAITRRTFIQASAMTLAVPVLAAPALASPALTQARDASNSTSQEDPTGMKTIMERHVADGFAAGMVWAIEHDGETRTGAAGTFEMGGGGAPMTRDAIFRIASITKPVTAALAMMLVEEGKLSLDGAVDALLPELADRRVLKRIDGQLDDTVPAQGPITLRQLLTMTFGLGAIMVFPEQYPIQKAMREAGIAPGPQLPDLSADDYMKRLGSLPLAYQPGAEFLYNNGLDVAGILISRAVGKPLSEVMQERVFAPLGMKDTGFHVPADKLHRLPPSYGRNFQTGAMEVFHEAAGGRFASPPPLESGAGGLVSTVDDYLAFARMLLSGGERNRTRLLKAETVAEMTRNQLTDAQIAGPQAGFFMEDGAAGWGLGMSVDLKQGKPWMTPGRFGWNGGYGTSAYIDTKHRLIGVFMSQRMMDSPEPPVTYVDFWTQAYKELDG
ncbi:serine hydrolase domain-containing protein [Nitratireductor pacificus]|uniref:Beta-lactamase n=1 Tax=Nitratireductor pacificus pht-3B TaxID=391937 RepID=K2MJR1_9HYPH|nr:serine hydrolase domain-containing protein [Nitratireductor pacificus]EKF17422.1 beta-lactamase [Nitratireductor pacificus pht-3B]